MVRIVQHNCAGLSVRDLGHETETENEGHSYPPLLLRPFNAHAITLGLQFDISQPFLIDTE